MMPRPQTFPDPVRHLQKLRRITYIQWTLSR